MNYDEALSTQFYQVYPTNDFIAFRKEEIEQSIASRFEAQVARYPERLALKTKDQQFTYEAFNKAANQVAQAILARRGEVAEPVALLLEQGSAPVIAIMGVVKAGKFYVPLDSSYPRARISYILTDSNARLIVTNQASLALAQELAQGRIQILNLDDLEAGLSTENPGLAISPDRQAYLMYTSGSTGQPKGVIEIQRNLLHHMMRITNGFHICKEDRQTLLRSYSFNGSVRDIFGTLLNGASLHPLNIERDGVDKLATWLIEEEITTYRSVISVFRNFASRLSGEEQFPRLRLFHVGGEPVTQRDVALFQTHFSEDCILVNGLGITETGSTRCFFIGKRSIIQGNHVPVGYPVEDMEVMILDDNGQAVGFDQVGEIAVKSRFLSPGYWRKPALTQAKFLTDPAGSDKRIYLTGDLGRMLPDSCLIHLGRKDFQVKIRGQRVEIAEIEAALLGLETVKEVVVVAQEDNEEERRLVAYLVPAQPSPPTVTALRRALAEMLPDYMIPAAFVMLASLPRMATGKVDRRALPLPEQTRPELETSFVAPQTPAEKTLSEIWVEVLKIDRVGVDDHFLELGGHSLMATQIVSRVSQAFQVDISPAHIFANPTVARLVQLIMQLKNSGPEVQKSTIKPILREQYRVPGSHRTEM
jgi:amino acid adenylation domain-containing protein